MKRLVLLLIVYLTLNLPITIKAQTNADAFQEGQVYVNNFEDLAGIILDETNGTVTTSPIIGTTTPNTPNALTIEHTSAGNVHGAIDLGQVYPELYIQYYASVVNDAGATNYTSNFEVGAGVNNLDAAKILLRHDANGYRPFGTSPSFVNLKRRTPRGAWRKYGIHINSTTDIVTYYIDGRISGTASSKDQDLRYITLGGTGNNKVGYKIQFASLTVNELGFQDVIENDTGVGTYGSFFIDYSLVDSGIDMTGWSGMQKEPIDFDGDGIFDDGPVLYLRDVGVSNVYAKKYDNFYFKRGVIHKIESLSKGHKVDLGATGNTATTFSTIDTYGNGDMPIVDSSLLVNPNDWEVYDVSNGIYRIALSNVEFATGAWQTGENRAHRQVFLVANLSIYKGSWFEDGTYFYIRLWDDSDPSLQEISIGTNQRPTMRNYGHIKNIHWRHASLNVANNMIVENCEFSKSSGASVVNSIFRDNKLYDLWSGVGYEQTEANNPGLGLGGSGDGGGIGLRENALVYRNTIDDAYLAVSIRSDAHDAVFAFNLIKNTVVNSISILNGGSPYDVNRPILIANNTVFASPRHIDNDPYPLIRDQPGHAFVHQNGDGGNFIFVNNMMLLHYNENISSASVMNSMSFTPNSLSVARGRIGYNKYYITPNSTAPAVIFNLGAGNNISTWQTTLGSNGDFKDLDGVSNPDSTSEVANSIPVMVAESSNTSGKWLETDPTPFITGGGYFLDYASYGITKDLSGNLLSNSLNIGAVSSSISETFTFSDYWSPSDPNGVATSEDDVVINSGDAIFNSNTICNSITVNPGAGLIVDSGVELITINGISLESNSTSYSSLIRNGTIVGDIEYKRHVNINGSGETGNNDLISAPLTGQAFNVFAGTNSNIVSNTDNTLYLFGPFNKDTSSYETWAATETAILDPGVGYRTASDDNDTFTFRGTANAETVSIDIENYGNHEAEWNLIGNPYPSYLNVQAFLNHNVGGSTNLELFDTGTAAIYGYDGSANDGWTIYNLATITASTVIAPGQGFFVSADETKTEAYDLEFTPDMRSTGTDDDFIAGRNTELVYLKLKATNSNNSVTTDFYFNDDSSLGFDFGYDAEIWGGEAPEFAMYSHLVQDNLGNALAIQSIDNSNLSNVTIPLGVNANQGEQLIFSISDSTLPEAIHVYLEDTITNTITLLNDLEYIITPATALSGTGRFFLKITENTLSTATNNLNNISIFTLNSSKELIVSGQLHDQTILNLYDMQGRSVLAIQLDSKNLINHIDMSNISKGVYIINLNSASHQITQKVVVN